MFGQAVEQGKGADRWIGAQQPFAHRGHRQARGGGMAAGERPIERGAVEAELPLIA
jgi:hypothetical protein